MTAPVVRLRDLSLGYRTQALVQGLSLDIHAGQTLAVLGANGAGKSTLIKSILGLIRPQAGAVEWPGGRPAEIGYLAQMAEFDRRFPLRVRDLAAMGAWKTLGVRFGLNTASRARVDAALDTAGVLEIADRPLHKLSGGQLQRALFARVIVQDAPLILLDEPFAGVDQTTEAHLLTLLDLWKREGRAVVLVLHDLSCVLDHCDQAVLLGAGQATHGATEQVLTPERLVAQGYLSSSQAAWMFRGQVALQAHPHG